MWHDSRVGTLIRKVLRLVGIEIFFRKRRTKNARRRFRFDRVAETITLITDRHNSIFNIFFRHKHYIHSPTFYLI